MRHVVCVVLLSVLPSHSIRYAVVSSHRLEDRGSFIELRWGVCPPPSMQGLGPTPLIPRSAPRINPAQANTIHLQIHVSNPSNHHELILMDMMICVDGVDEVNRRYCKHRHSGFILLLLHVQVDGQLRDNE